MDTHQGDENDSCYKRHNCKVRYVLSLLAFLSLVNLYAMRINLSIAMVVMMKTPKNDTKNNTHVCRELLKLAIQNNASDGLAKLIHGEFDWSPSLQGHLMSAFFYGYFFTPLLAGVVATTYGALWVLGGGVLVAGLFTLLTPIAARWSPWALFVVRIIVGIGSSVGSPSLHTLIGKWYPLDERSFQTTIIYNGGPTGCILALVCSGLLIKYLGGWPSVFYVTGCWLIYVALELHNGLLATVRDLSLRKDPGTFPRNFWNHGQMTTFREKRPILRLTTSFLPLCTMLKF